MNRVMETTHSAVQQDTDTSATSSFRVGATTDTHPLNLILADVNVDGKEKVAHARCMTKEDVALFAPYVQRRDLVNEIE